VEGGFEYDVELVGGAEYDVEFVPGGTYVAPTGGVVVGIFALLGTVVTFAGACFGAAIKVAGGESRIGEISVLDLTDCTLLVVRDGALREAIRSSKSSILAFTLATEPGLDDTGSSRAAGV
jgi:hypothetical protein